MADTSALVLVLAGTGKTGRRLAVGLRDAGVGVRTAARSRADVRFDWDDPATFRPALADVRRVYLVPPNTLDFASRVGAFLDLAATAGVEHVTYLSARGVERGPAEAAMRSVELQLMSQEELGWSVLRPAWFMQNFNEGVFLPGIVESGQIVGPAGNGAEAFISADDVAAVAAATLLDPVAHRSQAYTLTGPEALTFTQVAAAVAEQAGRLVSYVDIERDEWVRGALAAGTPADRVGLLAGLFDVIKSGAGAGTTTAVEAVLGRPPISFAYYAGTARSVWRPVGPPEHRDQPAPGAATV